MFVQLEAVRTDVIVSLPSPSPAASPRRLAGRRGLHLPAGTNPAAVNRAVQQICSTGCHRADAPRHIGLGRPHSAPRPDSKPACGAEQLLAEPQAPAVQRLGELQATFSRCAATGDWRTIRQGLLRRLSGLVRCDRMQWWPGDSLQQTRQTDDDQMSWVGSLLAAASQGCLLWVASDLAIVPRWAISLRQELRQRETRQMLLLAPRCGLGVAGVLCLERTARDERWMKDEIQAAWSVAATLGAMALPAVAA